MEILSLLDFSKRVLVVGDIILEKYIHGTYAKHAGSGLPTFTREKAEYRLAGSVNVVRNLQMMGMTVDLITMVGDNDKKVMDLLKETCIDTKGLYISHGFSFEKITRYFSKQCLSFQTVEIGTSVLSVEEKNTFLKIVNSINMDSYDLVVITCCGQEVSSSLLYEKIILQAQKHNIQTIVDTKSENAKQFHKATFMFIKEVEYCQQEDSFRALCKTICEECAVKCVFLSMCERGLSFYEQCERDDQSPSFQFNPISKDVKIIDSFGADDSALSAVMFGLVNNWCLSDTVNFALTCAIDVMTRFGIVPIDMINVVNQKVLTTSKELTALKRILSKDTKTVLTTGCFDLIHAGHIESLRQAKDIGDLVFVALNSDVSVKSYKGDKRPIITIDQRCSMLQAIKHVDFIIIFNESRPTWIVDILKPDVFVKGSEYTEEKLRQNFPILKEIHFTPQLTSTSEIIKKIQNL